MNYSDSLKTRTISENSRLATIILLDDGGHLKNKFTVLGKTSKEV